MLRRRYKKTRFTTVETEYGSVMLDESRGQYWHVNDTALQISQCLRGGGSRDDAAAMLMSTYGIDSATAARDVDATCEQLEKAGML